MFLQNVKVDQSSVRRECFDLTSKELDGILRVPFIDKLAVAVRYVYDIIILVTVFHNKK